MSDSQQPATDCPDPPDLNPTHERAISERSCTQRRHDGDMASEKRSLIRPQFSRVRNSDSYDFCHPTWRTRQVAPSQMATRHREWQPTTIDVGCQSRWRTTAPPPASLPALPRIWRTLFAIQMADPTTARLSMNQARQRRHAGDVGARRPFERIGGETHLTLTRLTVGERV